MHGMPQSGIVFPAPRHWPGHARHHGTGDDESSIDSSTGRCCDHDAAIIPPTGPAGRLTKAGFRASAAG